MTKLQNLLVGTALGALVAFPSLAQVTSDTTDITPAVGVTAVADGTSNLGTAPGESETVISAAFVGNPVVSSDGELLGTVTNAASNEDGTTSILVDIDQAVGAQADNFQMMLAAGEVSDGQIELIWTKAEVLGALATDAAIGTED